jgi:hypothetical protein
VAVAPPAVLVVKPAPPLELVPELVVMVALELVVGVEEIELVPELLGVVELVDELVVVELDDDEPVE